jgi:uncharacterized protein YecT (DUF1311 family)
MRLISISLLLGVLLHASAGCCQPAPAQPAWLLAYRGKSTNELAWDGRTQRLVETLVPSSVSAKVLPALGGPPDPVFVASDRYVSASACRPHSCTEKGFIWVDTQARIGLGAYAVDGDLLLGSNGMSAPTIPEAARRALIDWLTDNGLQTERAAFIGASGERVALHAPDFTARDLFKPPSGGPAFDCRRASGKIETAICADPDLSARDLAMGELYERVRHGNSITTDRDQLLDLQRKWLKDRNRDCAAAARMVECLKGKYAAQYDRLENWVPARTPGK